MFVVNLVLLVLAVWALVDCILRPAAAFPAVERQTKIAWIAILAVALLVLFIFGAISLVGLIGVVAVAFYFVDVRAKVVAITRR